MNSIWAWTASKQVYNELRKLDKTMVSFYSTRVNVTSKSFKFNERDVKVKIVWIVYKKYFPFTSINSYLKPYYNAATWGSGLGHHHTEIIVVRRPWVRFLTDPQLAIKRGENSEQADKLANAGYKCCGRWWNAKFCFELHSHDNLMKERHLFAQITIHVR